MREFDSPPGLILDSRLIFHDSRYARVAELVYAHDLKSCLERDVGSTPTPGTERSDVDRKKPTEGFCVGVEAPMSRFLSWSPNEKNIHLGDCPCNGRCPTPGTTKFNLPKREKSVRL